MSKYGIWRVDKSGPVKAKTSLVNLEKDLEDWIEADPTLLPGGLEIVGRQIRMEGGRLDLLALDPPGRWVVIEIKAGALLPEITSQAVYYASYIASMSFDQLEAKLHPYLAARNKDLKALLDQRGVNWKDQSNEREVIMVLVGTQRLSTMDVMLDYLEKKHNLTFSLVTFEMNELDTGEHILVRELVDEDAHPPVPSARTVAKESVSVEKVLEMADRNGVGPEFRLIHTTALELGLSLRPYRNSIMYTSPKMRTRMLFTVWAYRRPMRAYIGYDVFVQYYPVTAEQAASALGPQGWRELDMDGAAQFANGLRQLLSVDIS